MRIYATVMNKFAVAVRKDKVDILLPHKEMTYDDALLLAAYLVAMSEPFAEHKFEEVLNAVKST